MRQQTQQAIMDFFGASNEDELNQRIHHEMIGPVHNEPEAVSRIVEEEEQKYFEFGFY